MIQITALASTAVAYEKRTSHTQWASGSHLQYSGQCPTVYRAVKVSSARAGHGCSDSARPQATFHLHTAEIPYNGTDWLSTGGRLMKTDIISATFV